jgi:hypothetical protein
MAEIDFSVVLTSCGRFDLLRATIVSLNRCMDASPRKFLVIEDSGNAEVANAVADLNLDIQLVVNNPQLGQTRSIDKAYAMVETPLVFHCEDDWEFFRTGFIHESELILRRRADVSMVGLRSRAEQNSLVRNVPVQSLDGLNYFVHDTSLHPEYGGYSYNPGLRRMADYLRIGPFAPIGREDDVSYAFKRAGFAIANLENPAVRHIGDGRHVDDPTQPKKAKTISQKLMRSIRKRWRRAGRMLSG